LCALPGLRSETWEPGRGTTGNGPGFVKGHDFTGCGKAPCRAGLVNAHGFSALHLLQYQQCRIPLRSPVGLQQFRIHNESVAVLHQQTAAVIQLRLAAPRLTRQQCVRIGPRLVRLDGPLLAVRIHRRVAGIVRRRRILFILRLKALQARKRKHRSKPKFLWLSAPVSWSLAAGIGEKGSVRAAAGAAERSKQHEEPLQVPTAHAKSRLKREHGTRRKFV
jgi:hypothetical protein